MSRDFILICPEFGQLNVTLEEKDLNFCAIKQVVYNNASHACMIWLSLNPNPDDIDNAIDESLPLSHYNLHNGGVIFCHIYVL